tara:strand:- start:1352 stop:2536 length:1185 start_codon:yes stop_codon:yes gene_type:complete
MKNFHFDGPTWAFLTSEQMYDEEGELRRAHRHYQNADIYFMALMKKCFFNPKKTKVSLNGNIKCEILLGDPERKNYQHISVSYPLSEIWYAMPSVKASFRTREEFLFKVLFNQHAPRSAFRKRIYSVVKYLIRKNLISLKLGYRLLVAIYSSEIKVRHENRYEINVFDPLAESMTDESKAKKAKDNNPELYALNDADWDIKKKEKINFSKLPGYNSDENCRLKVDQIINHFNIDVGGQRIVYIGKTEKEPFDRLFPHAKLNELNGKLSINEFEGLVIHLLGFMNWDEPVYSSPPKTSLSKSDAITVAEAELINYFKPEENDIYVKDKGKSQWEYIKLLKRKGYSRIRGLLDIDGPYAKFYTPHLGSNAKNRHEIDVDLEQYRMVQQKDGADLQT